MAGLSPQLTNMAIMLFFFQASKKIPFDDPNVLNGVRGLYIFSNLLMFGIYYYMMRKIDAKKGMPFSSYRPHSPASNLSLKRSTAPVIVPFTNTTPQT